VTPAHDPDASLIEQQIRDAGTPSRAASEQNYLKSSMEFSGTNAPQIRAITTAWRRQHPDLTRERLIEIVVGLWNGRYFESKGAAMVLLTDRRKLLVAADADLVERFLREAGTWALVDGLAADVMGSLVQRFPQLLPTLDRWASDENFWIRRAAMLALLVPLRRGDAANFDRFARYADAMLEEREFFIRKAIGWVLRETAKKQPDLVADWLAPRVHRASGVTVREAVKWMPPHRGDPILAAYKESRSTTSTARPGAHKRASANAS